MNFCQPVVHALVCCVCVNVVCVTHGGCMPLCYMCDYVLHMLVLVVGVSGFGRDGGGLLFPLYRNPIGLSFI